MPDESRLWPVAMCISGFIDTSTTERQDVFEGMIKLTQEKPRHPSMLLGGSTGAKMIRDPHSPGRHRLLPHFSFISELPVAAFTLRSFATLCGPQ